MILDSKAFYGCFLDEEVYIVGYLTMKRAHWTAPGEERLQITFASSWVETIKVKKSI